MNRQRIIWVTTGVAALAVGMGLWLALWPSSGHIQSSSPVDGTTIQDSVQVQTGSASSQPSSGDATERGRIQDGMDGITIQDSVQVQTGSASSKPPSGGAIERGRIQDSMEYIIRDASGKIKESKSVGGQ